MHAASSRLLSPWMAHALGARASYALRVAVGVACLVMASQARLPFWGTPVPFTLAPQMVVALALVLGGPAACSSVVSFWALGTFGAPVFASGLMGMAAWAGPSSGYLLSYLPAAFVVGRWGRRQDALGLAVVALASLLILAGGAAVLSLWMRPVAAWHAGVVPFALSDLTKATLTWLLVRPLWPARAAVNAG